MARQEGTHIQGWEVAHYLLAMVSKSPSRLQVGLMGLVEREWLVCLATVEPDEVEYTDYVTCARNLLPSLRLQVNERTHTHTPHTHTHTHTHTHRLLWVNH